MTLVSIVAIAEIALIAIAFAIALLSKLGQRLELRRLERAASLTTKRFAPGAARPGFDLRAPGS